MSLESALRRKIYIFRFYAEILWENTFQHISSHRAPKTKNRNFEFCLKFFYVPGKYPKEKNLHFSFLHKNISGEHVSTYFWSFKAKNRISKILSFGKISKSPMKKGEKKFQNFFSVISYFWPKIKVWNWNSWKIEISSEGHFEL